MLNTESKQIFVTCPKGLNYVLEKELQGIGAKRTKSIPAGVHADVDKKTIYQILLWSRIANRVILPLSEAKVESIEQVYQLVYDVNWESHFSCDAKFVVNFNGKNTFINNTEFGALKVKDAIVDRFRDKTGERPSVDRKEPEIRISAVLSKGKLSVGIDLSGESLHKRGYRSVTGKAPLKENLAAGILTLAGWPDKFEDKASFVDPMCGSGTFLIEAAMMVSQKAPGLNRERWGFSKWLFHDERMWQAIRHAASEKYEETLKQFESTSTPKIIGFDQDSRVVSRAWENIQASGFDSMIHVEKRSLVEFATSQKFERGLVLTNPPYGERLGTIKELIGLYQTLGEVFENHLLGWTAGIFTGNLDLGKSIGWRSYKQYKLFNGALESQLILVDLDAKNRYRDKADFLQSLKAPESWKISNQERAEMFRNRLKKNLKSLKKWTNKEHISCYRLYDADMPEFAIAVDVYKNLENESYLHVQEYMAPKSVSAKLARERLSEALKVLEAFGKEVFDLDAVNISVKQRSVQKGVEQYQKEDATQRFMLVEEFGIKFRVNLFDYLDTGLFLDHRPTRRKLANMAKGKRILNLFSYTGAATLYAVAGGAASSLSVDMSKTYLRWLEQNLAINGMDGSLHTTQQADCMQWLIDESNTEKFDLIFLDPPSFSNSKRMEGVLDIQRDHAPMIDLAMQKLNEGGILIFSNNLRKFKLDPDLESEYHIRNISRDSFDPDFQRNKNLHQVWQISR